MTSVLLNRVDTDIVDLSVLQTGANETVVMLRDSLLLGQKDYRFAVTELSVPMQNIDMFGFMTGSTELFTIQRRTYNSLLTEYDDEEQKTFEDAILADVGVEAYDFADIVDDIVAEENIRDGPAGSTFDLPAGGAVYGNNVIAVRDALKNLWSVVPTTGFEESSTYTVFQGRKFYDISQFVKSLADFAKTFNTTLLTLGINVFHYGGKAGDPGLIVAQAFNGVAGYEFLKVYQSCDGNLCFRGDAFFWDNFTIRFTNTGSALLGVDTDILHDRWLVVTNDRVGTDGFVDNTNHILRGYNNAITISQCPISVFQSAECRIKAAIESHLPVQSSIEVRDNVETNNREICSAFFLNDVRVNCTWDAEGTLENYSLETRVFAGQYPLIHQNSRIKQWNRLLTAYNLQYFRFFLNVHYRYFDEASGVWKTLIKRATVAPNDYWSFKIRFVSDE